MYIRPRNILIVGTLLALALPALAQGPPPAPRAPGAPGFPGAPGGRGGQQGPGMRRGPSLAMLPVNVLETITPLKADQRTRISAIQEKARADMKTADRTARMGIMTKANDDVKAILTPAQAAEIQKSMPTLALISQSRAIPMGALGEVKLTKDQMNKIRGITAATAGQLQGLRGPERQAKMQVVGPQLKTQIEGVLTQAQKDTITRYEAAHPRGGRGGFGGRPGNG